MTNEKQHLDTFTQAYIEAALWASHASDENGKEFESLEEFDNDQIDPKTLAVMVADCTKFQAENSIPEYSHPQYCDEEMAGHDFFLTRCGHGAGFWDRGLGEIGDKLTKAAEAYGDFYFWVEGGIVFGEKG